MIRKAEIKDLRRIVEMSERFYQYTSYWQYSKIPFSPDDAAILAMALIDASVLNVVEVENSVVGMIGVIFIPFLFNTKYTHAGEVIWWVEPEFMNCGYGRELLRSVEPACKSAGVTHIQMINLANSSVSSVHLYESEGYVLTENSFTKVL
jgi:RimJ/RimL family protein N-acetyltransferase